MRSILDTFIFMIGSKVSCLNNYVKSKLSKVRKSIQLTISKWSKRSNLLQNRSKQGEKTKLIQASGWLTIWKISRQVSAVQNHYFQWVDRRNEIDPPSDFWQELTKLLGRSTEWVSVWKSQPSNMLIDSHILLIDKTFIASNSFVTVTFHIYSSKAIYVFKFLRQWGFTSNHFRTQKFF